MATINLRRASQAYDLIEIEYGTGRVVGRYMTPGYYDDLPDCDDPTQIAWTGREITPEKPRVRVKAASAPSPLPDLGPRHSVVARMGFGGAVKAV